MIRRSDNNPEKLQDLQETFYYEALNNPVKVPKAEIIERMIWPIGLPKSLECLVCMKLANDPKTCVSGCYAIVCGDCEPKLIEPACPGCNSASGLKKISSSHRQALDDHLVQCGIRNCSDKGKLMTFSQLKNEHIC